jgi:DNA-binding NarL/FixJ family response regulator
LSLHPKSRSGQSGGLISEHLKILVVDDHEDPHKYVCALPQPRFAVVGQRYSVRALVVEDFAPFRKFICSTLVKRPNLQVICELSDGQEAVQKAEELKPDLIFLDIGLPTLDGIEAARRIRILAPQSKIIFVSQESSPEIVQPALNLGARGYVVKTRVAIDLLPAVEAVLEGRQFVSSGLIAGG